MAIKQKVSVYSKQDKLNDGLLRTENGDYVKISNYGKSIDDFWESFAPLSKQDRLKEGLMKIDRTEDYILIDNLDEIENNDCFIATTVYGDIKAPQLKILRDFRNNILMHNITGRAFVDFYYNGHGKRVADFIRECTPSTIPLIRRGLDALVKIYSTKEN